MSRPVLFFDLVGTLEVRNPATGRWGAWPGVAELLAGLAVDHDLHVTTGDSAAVAASTLEEYGLGCHFRHVHADLPGDGKPFGALAADLGCSPENCLAIGDNPLSDTAGDTDRVVSVLLAHRRELVAPDRVAAIVGALDESASFLAGFLAAARTGSALDALAEIPTRARLQDLAPTRLGGGGRLGWWLKTPQARRPVVVLSA